ncbi:MAG TPA: aminotransferase class V-fold PLP-dependent enzyme [Candidatus Paceibacterota bacterium]|nr:aminotransferase class V-fold PLP-dependent enzyme [Candidatus Paceibacterota bacterium]
MVFGTTRIYLDWAAAAPVSPRALLAFSRAIALAGNPSSPHAEGRAARDVLEDARVRIARLAGTKPDAVIFTSGATEANALGITGHLRALIEEGGDPAQLHVLYLPSAHASVIGAMRALERIGVATEAITKLEAQLRPETVLVVVDLVCGETGQIYKVRDIRRALDRTGRKIALFADASQAPRVESFELQRLGADMVSLDAQKVGGVRGIGALIAPRNIPLRPLSLGGGQERGLRPGTESPALAAAFATALEECARDRSAFTAAARDRRIKLTEALRAIPRMEINEGKLQAPHILNLSLIGRDTDYLLALLDEAGFAISTKSACETDEAGSRAVLAMTDDAARASSTLRISWGPATKPRDLDRFADALISTVRFADQNAI